MPFLKARSHQEKHDEQGSEPNEKRCVGWRTSGVENKHFVLSFKSNVTFRHDGKISLCERLWNGLAGVEQAEYPFRTNLRSDQPNGLQAPGLIARHKQPVV
jgi:hypothetical protein